MQFTCVVSDFTYDDGSNNKQGERSASRFQSSETPEERCARFSRWLLKYQKDGTEGHTVFLDWVAIEDATVSDLTKLKVHMESDGGAAASGKVGRALEGKAKTLYRRASLELVCKLCPNVPCVQYVMLVSMHSSVEKTVPFPPLQHPDKVSRKLSPGCATEDMRNMLSLVFERVKRLKECVMRPLRCELEPEEQGQGFSGAGKQKGRKKKYSQQSSKRRPRTEL